MRSAMPSMVSMLAPALVAAGGCATPGSEAAPAPQTREISAPTGDAAEVRTSVLPALERVLEVLVVPKVDAAGCELARLDARSDPAGVRSVLDVDVTGPDEVTVNVRLERLLDSLRTLEGARGVEVRRSRTEGPTRARLEGVSIELAAESARPQGDAGEADWMTALRNLASDPATRLGGVEIERRGDDDDALRVSAYKPDRGRRLDRLRSYMAAIESQLPGANVVRVSLEPGGSDGAAPSEPPLYHWRIDIERGA